MARNKLTISTYECNKCNKTIYFRTGDEIYTTCKTCKSEMEFHGTHPYYPKHNIKQANMMNHQIRTKHKNTSSPTITCPYCKSTDCKKISGLSKAVSVGLFGLFALGKTTKQWHCNNCNSDF